MKQLRFETDTDYRVAGCDRLGVSFTWTVDTAGVVAPERLLTVHLLVDGQYWRSSAPEATHRARGGVSRDTLRELMRDCVRQWKASRAAIFEEVEASMARFENLAADEFCR